ncbi:MAG: RNA methyltransferase [Zoogloeaceae bacterium]|nr:RNA methyltransferase [Zoogloeaceae bacterium]
MTNPASKVPENAAVRREKRIVSRENPDFRAWKKLRDSSRARRKQGRLLLEGIHLVMAWQAAWGMPEVILVSESGRARPEIRVWIAQTGARVTELADSLFRELSATETPGGILAVVTLPVPASPPAANRDSLLLDGVQDPGNLGTLLRSAAAAGVGQVLLSTDCAEAWSPKALRAGQGAHFTLRVHEDVDLPCFLAAFQGDTLAATLEDAVSLHAATWRHPVAWVMGAEGQGARPETLAACRQRVYIPMPGAVESLNVGAAAAVCLFEMVRRRHA